MKKEKKFSGVVVPMVTFLNKDRKIDEEATEKLVEHIVSNKCCPFVLGTTGEAQSLSIESKMVLVKRTITANKGRRPLYAGITSNCMEDTLSAGKRYFDMGADVLVAHLPSYYPLPPEYMKRYFEELAEQLPAPMLIYNIPLTTYMSIPVELVEQLSYHENIAGIKDSERDDARLNKMIKLLSDREDFSFLIGWAARSVYALKNGTDGIVLSTANAFPDLYFRLYEATRSENLSEAEKLQQITDEITLIYQKDKLLSQQLPGLKIILEEIGIGRANDFSPCYALSEGERNAIVHRFRELKAKCIG